MKERLIVVDKVMVQAVDLYSEKLIELVGMAPGSGYTIGCGNCTEGYCCMQATAAFLAEAIYIAKRHPVPRHLWAEYNAQGMKMEGTARGDYFETRTRCLYMSPDKSCSIYADRPMCCRKYYVACESEKCSPDYKDTVPVVNVMELDILWVEMMVQLNLLLGIDPGALGALPRMMVIATRLLENPDQSFLDRQTWLNFHGPMAAM